MLQFFVLVIILSIWLCTSANINTKDSDNSDIFYASRTGDLHTVKQILSASSPHGTSSDASMFDVNAKDNDENTALLYASGEGHNDIVRLLITAGADVNVTDIHTGLTPLLFASMHGHNEVLISLLNANANMYAKFRDGNTALTAACMQGNTAVVQTLVTAASESKSAESLQLFLEEKDQNIHSTALLYACSSSSSISSSDRDSNNAANNVTTNATTVENMNNYKDIVEILLKAGSNTEVRNSDGYTPLLFASLQGHIDIVKLLLAYGADIHKKTHWFFGGTPRQLALSKNYTGVVEILDKEIQYQYKHEQRKEERNCIDVTHSDSDACSNTGAIYKFQMRKRSRESWVSRMLSFFNAFIGLTRKK